MRQTASIAATMLLAWAVWVSGAVGEEVLAVPDEAQRVAEIQAQMMAGNTDDALKAAKEFLKTSKDKDAKTEAMRVVAEGLRKKGDWRGAVSAYRVLAERFDKGSDDCVRFGAIGDVLATSQNGVYKVAVGTAPKTGTETPAKEPRTLADDAALDEALALLASFRISKLKGRCGAVRSKRSPQDVMKVFTPLAEDARQVFLLGPDTPPADAREMGTMAGQRMGQLGTQVQGALRNKLQKYQPKFNNPWSFSNVEKKDIQQTHKLCKEMADAERAFQVSLAHVTGSGEWPEGDGLRIESTERSAAYLQLAEEYIVPAYRTIWY
ncbi:MAG TPA: hypothetical protein VM431_15005 [Phycisphaerae bacterium]|nr:hypothetical protein [Phycisphaerae bacterium]